MAVNEPKVLARNELECRALRKCASEFVYLSGGSFEGGGREKSGWLKIGKFHNLETIESRFGKGLDV